MDNAEHWRREVNHVSDILLQIMSTGEELFRKAEEHEKERKEVRQDTQVFAFCNISVIIY